MEIQPLYCASLKPTLDYKLHWLITIHKGRFFKENILKNKEMVFKRWVEKCKPPIIMVEYDIIATIHLPENSAYLPQFEILTKPLKSLHSCWPAIRCKSQSYQASARDLGSDNTPFITVRLNLNYFSPHHYVFIRLDGLPGDAGMSKILVKGQTYIVVKTLSSTVF